MADINWVEELKAKEQQLLDVKAFASKLEGAIEMLKLLKDQAEKVVEKVEEKAKAVEAEVVEEDLLVGD